MCILMNGTKDERIKNFKERFKIKICFSVIDILRNPDQERFKSFKEI